MQQKIVVKVSMDSDKKTRKALKIAVSISGVVSASFVGSDKDQIAVTGDGIDSVELSVGPVEAKKEEPKKPTVQVDPSYQYYYQSYGVPYYYSYYY
ncbi:putative heavy metal-associated isoprenylated plant protein/47 [Helianthus annuus]|nr:putative heavy metal-associated isoprenylated plant protein/47 [Helianthus annuus]KAJ0810614.1 putative heavy metal-associated isoprenylated plant protein/47 [Helianthus annuus]